MVAGSEIQKLANYVYRTPIAHRSAFVLVINADSTRIAAIQNNVVRIVNK
jgi:hypothetical protein